jgi:hypothetical protein
VDGQGSELKRKQRSLPAGKITADLFEFIYVKSCGTMCAKTTYEETGGFDTSLRRCAVYKSLLRLSLSHRFIPVEGPTYKKRRHAANPDRSFANCKIELEVLEDFYFNGGGKAVIPKRTAMKRLSAEGYRVGRCAIKEGMGEEARKYLIQSLRRYPNIKSFVHLPRAMFVR